MQQDIITVARRWMGVPFVHQGRSRTGVDCLGLLMMVAEELGLQGRDGALLTTHDCCEYGKVPDGVRLQSRLQRVLYPRVGDAVQQADVVLCRIDAMPQHVAIIGNYVYGGLSIIHAYAPARKVVEHPLDAYWQRRIMQVFHL
jgi:cell wall-associated NlpC family hydrolase